MKKVSNTFRAYKVSTIILFFTIFLGTPLYAFAVQGMGTRIKNALRQTGYNAGFFSDPDNPPDFVTILGAYINGILGLMGVVFLVWVIVGGYIWMTASGNEEKVMKAKKMITGASIGIAVILLSATIVNFVLSIIGPAATGKIP